MKRGESIMEQLSKVLVLNFKGADGAVKPITISDPNLSATPTEIKTAAEAVVASGAFGGQKMVMPVSAIKDAQYVTRMKDVVALA